LARETRPILQVPNGLQARGIRSMIHPCHVQEPDWRFL
jgi:hypothetical protein